MIKKSKKNKSIILNSIITILGLIAVISMYFSLDETQLIKSGWQMFTLYTVDSNILLIISSIIVIIDLIKNNTLSKFSYILKLSATLGVITTFLVVMLYLGFIMGWKNMIGGPNFILHIVNPILACLSFILYEYKSTKKSVVLYTLVPPFIYTIIMYVLILGGSESPYPFLDIRNNNIIVTLLSSIGIGTSIYFVGLLIWYLNKKLNKINRG